MKIIIGLPVKLAGQSGSCIENLNLTCQKGLDGPAHFTTPIPDLPPSKFSPRTLTPPIIPSRTQFYWALYKSGFPIDLIKAPPSQLPTTIASPKYSPHKCVKEVSQQRCSGSRGGSESRGGGRGAGLFVKDPLDVLQRREGPSRHSVLPP